MQYRLEDAEQRVKDLVTLEVKLQEAIDGRRTALGRSELASGKQYTDEAQGVSIVCALCSAAACLRQSGASASLPDIKMQCSGLKSGHCSIRVPQSNFCRCSLIRITIAGWMIMASPHSRGLPMPVAVTTSGSQT